MLPLLNADLDDLNTVSHAYGSVKAVVSAIVEIATLNLKAGHTYIILCGVQMSTGVSGDAMSAILEKKSGDAQFIVPCPTARTTSASGGGVVNLGVVICTTDCVVSLSSYGYINQDYNFSGRIIAVKIQ